MDHQSEDQYLDAHGSNLVIPRIKMHSMNRRTVEKLRPSMIDEAASYRCLTMLCHDSRSNVIGALGDGIHSQCNDTIVIQSQEIDKLLPEKFDVKRQNDSVHILSSITFGIQIISSIVHFLRQLLHIKQNPGYHDHSSDSYNASDSDAWGYFMDFTEESPRRRHLGFRQSLLEKVSEEQRTEDVHFEKH